MKPEFNDTQNLKMPPGTISIKNFPGNLNKHIYELSLSLFDQCNLHCSFCFENDLRKTTCTKFDKDYILSIPEKTFQYVSQKLKAFKTQTLYVRIWGGEIFMDSLHDQAFLTYKQLCQSFLDLYKREFPHLKVIFNFMTNGIWKKRDRVIDVAKEFNSTIGFSYDPIGRYQNEELRELAISNINFVFEELKYVNVATTATKPNIKAIIANQDSFFNHLSPNIALEFNSYIPNSDWVINMPSEEDFYQLLKYTVDNSLFMINSTVSYVESALGLTTQKQTICDCKCSVQYSNGKFISDCVMKSSSLDINHFYQNHFNDVNDDNCHDVKMFLAAKKRKCLECKYFDKCPGFCTASVLFDKYEKDVCPIKKLYHYIECNRSKVLSDFNRYKEKNKLPYQMI